MIVLLTWIITTAWPPIFCDKPLCPCNDIIGIIFTSSLEINVCPYWNSCNTSIVRSNTTWSSWNLFWNMLFYILFKESKYSIFYDIIHIQIHNFHINQVQFILTILCLSCTLRMILTQKCNTCCNFSFICLHLHACDWSNASCFNNF